MRIPRAGERVLLTSDKTVWRGIMPSMKPFLGTVQTVSSVRSDGLFYIEDGDGWCWTPECIEAFVEDKQIETASDPELMSFLGI